mmetsp:Transcript_51795/g.167041  ORF Transcript_51795/g.167041 Transcript_51795/m.167041 type:complete len:225 (-) Transcript_51795:486-1160(-)
MSSPSRVCALVYQEVACTSLAGVDTAASGSCSCRATSAAARGLEVYKERPLAASSKIEAARRVTAPRPPAACSSVRSSGDRARVVAATRSKWCSRATRRAPSNVASGQAAPSAPAATPTPSSDPSASRAHAASISASPTASQPAPRVAAACRAATPAASSSSSDGAQLSAPCSQSGSPASTRPVVSSLIAASLASALRSPATMRGVAAGRCSAHESISSSNAAV